MLIRWLTIVYLIQLSPLTAGILGGTVVTPSVYRITLKRVEFLRDDGSYRPFTEGSFTFDIASVNKGQAVGSFAEGKSLRPGRYNGVRLTFSRNIGIAAEGIHNGKRLRTQTGNPSDLTYGNLTALSAATVDGNSPSIQEIALPSGATYCQALCSQHIVELPNSDLQILCPVSFFLADGKYVPPLLRFDFDVQDSVELVATGPSSGLVIPLAPCVRLSLQS